MLVPSSSNKAINPIPTSEPCTEKNHGKILRKGFLKWVIFFKIRGFSQKGSFGGGEIRTVEKITNFENIFLVIFVSVRH